ncbi:FecR family protein [Sphingomonas sp. PB4P5]|uniref:FecR family protein n=1 Tax=Parasphingomonas puruogangriensis TaxID=3096155 RepID=UPI002FC5ED58
MTIAVTKARLATLTPAEGAALWMVQQDQGAPVEAGLFEDWLAQSEANRAAWAAVDAAWDLFDDADDPAFAALREAALADVAPPGRSRLPGGWRSVAAAVALIVAVAGGVHLSQPPSDSDQIAAATGPSSTERTYASPRGAIRDVVLADGTHMTLGSEARARVDLSGRRRQVALDRGDAVFAVVHDAARPFAVTAGDRTIVDVGTRFKVAIQQDALTVSLYEGSVRIDDRAGHATTLSPGQQLVARAGRRDTIMLIAAGDGAGGDLAQFDDVTLAAAAETINAGSTVKLVITDPAVGRLRVSGQFRLRDPQRFARTVSELLSLRVVRATPTRLELRKRR